MAGRKKVEYVDTTWDERHRMNRGAAPTAYGPNQVWRDMWTRREIPEDELFRYFYGTRGESMRKPPVSLWDSLAEMFQDKPQGEK